MRKQYSKKEIKEFLAAYPYADGFMDKKSQVVEEDNKLLVSGKIAFRKVADAWIPSLELLKEHPVLPKVVVDKGTPPFIAKGADLMRPGIVSCEEFEKEAVVMIVDEVHSFPLATGRAMFSSVELMTQEGGKVIKIIHNLSMQ